MVTTSTSDIFNSFFYSSILLLFNLFSLFEGENFHRTLYTFPFESDSAKMKVIQRRKRNRSKSVFLKPFYGTMYKGAKYILERKKRQCLQKNDAIHLLIWHSRQKSTKGANRFPVKCDQIKWRIVVCVLCCVSSVFFFLWRKVSCRTIPRKTNRLYIFCFTEYMPWSCHKSFRNIQLN